MTDAVPERSLRPCRCRNPKPEIVHGNECVVCGGSRRTDLEWALPDDLPSCGGLLDGQRHFMGHAGCACWDRRTVKDAAEAERARIVALLDEWQQAPAESLPFYMPREHGDSGQPSWRFGYGALSTYLQGEPHD